MSGKFLDLRQNAQEISEEIEKMNIFLANTFGETFTRFRDEMLSNINNNGAPDTDSLQPGIRATQTTTFATKAPQPAKGPPSAASAKINGRNWRSQSATSTSSANANDGSSSRKNPRAKMTSKPAKKVTKKGVDEANAY